MISSRFALPAIIVLIIALVPTVIHSYLGLTKHDDRLVASINTVLNNFSSSPSTRNPGWGEETFDSFDWTERIYRDEHGHAVRLFVGRSYDHKRLYHHPELALSYARDLGHHKQVYLPSDPTIAINVLQNPTRPGLAAYALVVDDEFIANPIVHQLQDSLHLLIGARKSMTLFYVADDLAPINAPFEQSPAASVLISAIKDFLAK